MPLSPLEPLLTFQIRLKTKDKLPPEFGPQWSDVWNAFLCGCKGQRLGAYILDSEMEAGATRHVEKVKAMRLAQARSARKVQYPDETKGSRLAAKGRKMANSRVGKKGCSRDFYK